MQLFDMKIYFFQPIVNQISNLQLSETTQSHTIMKGRYKSNDGMIFFTGMVSLLMLGGLMMGPIDTDVDLTELEEDDTAAENEAQEQLLASQNIATPASDVLSGTDLDDVIDAMNGDDQIQGGDDADNNDDQYGGAFTPTACGSSSSSGGQQRWITMCVDCKTRKKRSMYSKRKESAGKKRLIVHT